MFLIANTPAPADIFFSGWRVLNPLCTFSCPFFRALVSKPLYPSVFSHCLSSHFWKCVPSRQSLASNTGFGHTSTHTHTQPAPNTWGAEGTCAFVCGGQVWRGACELLYSAFLLAVAEFDSFRRALEWIVERIEGSIPISFCGRHCAFLGLVCMCDLNCLACIGRSDLRWCVT